jgi:hypothetical protein
MKDQIKEENSDLTTQNRNLVYILSFVTLLGLLFTIKAQKTKNRVLLYKQQQQKNQRGYL